MQSVSDNIVQESTAIAVNPETIGIKPPTNDPRCGTPAGTLAHRRRGERRCRDCMDASNAAREVWVQAQEEREDRLRAERAAQLRPSLTVLLTAHGVHDPEAAIAALERHGYGDYSTALLEAAKASPIGTNHHTDGGSIRAWLRGRAALIRKEL